MSVPPDNLERIFAQVDRLLLPLAAAESAGAAVELAAEAAHTLFPDSLAVTGFYWENGELGAFTSYPPQLGQDNLTTLMNWLLNVARASEPTDFPKLFPNTGSYEVNGQEISAALLAPVFLENQVAGVIGVINPAGSINVAHHQQLTRLASYACLSFRQARMVQARQQQKHQLINRTRQLSSFSQAISNIATELSLDKVLQQIVDSARELVQAEYVALGVPSSSGALEAFVYSGLAPEQAGKMTHLPRGLGLLGAIIKEKRPIRIPDIAADPRSVGFPAGHPKMRSFVGAPIVAGGQTLGNLYLTNKIGAREFSAEDQNLVELLAKHAAVAIQNARLYAQVRRLVIAEERNRIGMDLHDGVIQSIFAVGLTLESARLSLGDDGADEADRLLDIAIDGLNNTIRDIRNFILDLRPHRFKGNLREGLTRLVREFQVNAMVEVKLDAVPEIIDDLPATIARALFLTTQEALANVARHARASHVHVQLSRINSSVQLSIVDDGKGFDLATQMKASVGHGLSNMRTRTEELGGKFDLDSGSGRGTRITLLIPVK